MTTDIVSDTSLKTWDSSGAWRIDPGVDHWAFGELESDATVAPHNDEASQVSDFISLSSTAIPDRGCSPSWLASATFTPAYLSPAITGLFNKLYLNPVLTSDYDSQILGLGLTQDVGNFRLTFPHNSAIGEHIVGKLWTVAEQPIDLGIELAEVFSLAEGEHFEDGIESRFSLAIGAFVKRHRLGAIDAIRRATDQNLYRDTYVAEALLWIGELDDERTEHARRLLLEAACGSDVVSVRDAAVSGLAYLGPVESQGRLERMLKEENVRGVRANIEAVLAYVRD